MVTLLMYLAAVSAERTRSGQLENHERCPGSAPVSWIPASECGTGACGADWNTSHPLMVPRCAGRSTLRHFNRSSVMQCLRQLSSMSGKPRYRLLMGGVSNALHIFRALQDDDSLEPWERERSRKAHPSCPPLSTVRLRAFAPHALVRHAQPLPNVPAPLSEPPPHCVVAGLPFTPGGHSYHSCAAPELAVLLAGARAGRRRPSTVKVITKS